MDMSPIKDAADLAARILQMGGPADDKAELGFDMLNHWEVRRYTYHPCGTACCIGGLVQGCNPELNNMHLHKSVSALTGWAGVECDKLCFPDHHEAYNATPAQGARAVQIMIETGGICDWDRAMKEGA